MARALAERERAPLTLLVIFELRLGVERLFGRGRQIGLRLRGAGGEGQDGKQNSGTKQLHCIYPIFWGRTTPGAGVAGLKLDFATKLCRRRSIDKSQRFSRRATSKEPLARGAAARKRARRLQSRGASEKP